ncbi:MAG: DUF4105 domain-containing protein [Sphaerochaetaceae bacterium]|nr:DUF4105 domain-containing protein [Sphaerochaetaceae bacterium]
MKQILLLCTTLLLFLTPISAISLIPQHTVDNPNSSVNMLSGEDFWDTEAVDENRYRLYLTTMGRDDPLYVWFGHTSLVVEDTKSGREVMYDFGIISFEEGFYRAFALGRMWYLTWATDANMRVAMASADQRNISTVELNLPQKVIVEVLRHLNTVTDKEHSTYLYHYYDENCSTRIRDIIDTSVKGEFKQHAESIALEATLRELVAMSTAGSPAVMWALDFLQSGSIDTEITLWQAMFLPRILEEAVLEFSYTAADGSSIPLTGVREVLSVEPEGLRPDMAQSRGRANLILFAGSILLALASLLLKRGYINARHLLRQTISLRLYGLITVTWTFVLSAFLLATVFLMTFTTHDVTYFNENILIASPLVILMFFTALPFLVSRERHMPRMEKLSNLALWISTVHILLKVLLPEYLIQDNANIFFTILPLYLANSTYVRPLLGKAERNEQD